MVQNSKPIYFNPAQREIITVDAHTTVVVGGRRLGKTFGIIAPKLLRLVQRMPGCSIGIVVSSYKRGLTNTLPGTLKALEDWGYKRGVHWYIGRKPPKDCGFASPIIEPVCYDYVISWYNGTVCYIISQDIPGSSNSLTLDAVLVDEAKFINYDKFKDETVPANGGTKAHFGKKYYHHSTMIVSDMPVEKSKSWFLKYEDNMDNDVIDAIRALQREILYVKNRIIELKSTNQPLPNYLESHLKSLYKNLARFRSIALFYKEYSSIWNLEVLGEKYIKQMKRDLTPLTFWTSIMSKRIGQAKDGFYSKMRDKNVYNASDVGFLETLDYDFDQVIATNDCRQDADLNKEMPIAIGMDYNANINWIVAGQLNENRLNIVKSFYVKYDRKIPELIQDFCKYYYYHRCKEVVFYYDATAVGNNYAVSKDDFHSVIAKEFKRHGWRVKSIYLGAPMRHDEKHLLINRMFASQTSITPYLNEQNNEELITSLKIAGVYNGKKDKRGEKLGETELDKLELRTDGTDAFDTLCIGVNRSPYSNYRSIYIPSGVMG